MGKNSNRLFCRTGKDGKNSLAFHGQEARIHAARVGQGGAPGMAVPADRKARQREIIAAISLVKFRRWMISGNCDGIILFGPSQADPSKMASHGPYAVDPSWNEDEIVRAVIDAILAVAGEDARPEILVTPK